MSYIGSSPKVNRLRLNPRATDPVNPSEGDLQYADGSAREEGVWVYKNSAWVKVGSDQAGDINYISNGDAEAGSTAGWSLGNVTLTSAFPSGTPTFGSGANANLSFTNTTVTPLAGTRSFLYASSAATTAGNFVASDAFTVDPADRARVLQIAFNYQLVSGTANFSGTSSNSFGIAIYDVTAAQWIMPAGVWNLVQSSGVGRATATFQTSATSTQYRLVLFNANATSGAVSLELDRISVGPQKQVLAPAISDWTSFTPTGSWTTNATYTGRWRRVGDSIEVNARVTLSGAPTATTLALNIPFGLNIDTSKLTNTGIDEDRRVGYGSILDSGTQRYFCFVNVWDATTVRMYVSADSTSGYVASNTSVTQITPMTFAAGDIVDVRFTVPIVGWSSNSVMSNDTDTRVVAASMSNSATYTTTANALIPFNTTVYDTHGAISLASGRVTAPTSGYYRVSVNAFYRTSGVGGSLFVYKNNASYASIFSFSAAVSSFSGVLTLQLNAGDFVDVRTDASMTLGAGYMLNVERISGPAVVAATETVAVKATTATARSINNTTPTVVYENKIVDTHNAYNNSNGVFTVPVSGLYQISGYVRTVSAGFSSGQATIGTIRLNGNLSSSGTWGGTRVFASPATAEFGGATLVRLNAGDTVSIAIYCDINTTLGVADTTINHFNIIRVGN